MTFIVFAWIAVLFYGVSALVGKLATKYHINNPWLYNFVWNLLILLFTILFALYAGVGLPHRWDTLWLIGIVNALTSVLYILALYRLDLSVLAPLYIFRAPLSVLLGIFLFGETLTLIQVAMIGTITIAGMFVSMDERFSLSSFFQKPIALALGAIAASAVYGATIKNAMAYDGYWEVTLWSTILTQAALIVTWPKFSQDLFWTAFSQYRGVAASAFFIAVGTLAAYKAYAVNISLTSAIMALPFSMILTFILALIAPKLLERHALRVYTIRFAAAGVMFMAALQLSG